MGYKGALHTYLVHGLRAWPFHAGVTPELPFETRKVDGEVGSARSAPADAETRPAYARAGGIRSYVSGRQICASEAGMPPKNGRLSPQAIESISKGYSLAIGYSFTGKPLKDGFCHIVTYSTHVNLSFNRGAQLPDPSGILVGKGK